MELLPTKSSPSSNSKKNKIQLQQCNRLIGWKPARHSVLDIFNKFVMESQSSTKYSIGLEPSFLLSGNPERKEERQRKKVIVANVTNRYEPLYKEDECVLD